MLRPILACSVVVALGCGGDDDGSSGPRDAATSEPDARVGSDASASFDAAVENDAGLDGGLVGVCNPVTQQGCEANEKCSWLVVQDDPFLGRTDCVPDGTVAIGDACVEGPPGEETGYDDCAAGGVCVNDRCRTICSIEPDSCDAGFACSTYLNLFSDDVADNTGVCDSTCDPVVQDCLDDGEGCYLQLYDGVATCANVGVGAEDNTQGVQCENDGQVCFLNGCAEGYGGFLYAGQGVPRDCTAFCSPVDTYLVDPDGDGAGSLVGGADADGAAPYDCSEARIGVLNHQCRFFQSYFVDMNGNYLDYVSDTYGFCTPRNAEFGNCNRFSEEWFLETYNQFIEGGGSPEEWRDYITGLCDATPARCANGCARVATLAALDDAYCAVPANAGRPACAAGLLGVRIVRRSLERIWAERRVRAERVRD